MKLTETPPFKVVGASYNYWVGGQPGVSGIKVNIGIDSNSKIEFDSIYYLKYQAKVENKTIKGKTYIIGNFDTSTRERELELQGDDFNEVEKPKKSHPFELKENEAVIRFNYQGKIKYYKVLKMKKTKSDFYP